MLGFPLLYFKGMRLLLYNVLKTSALQGSDWTTRAQVQTRTLA